MLILLSLITVFIFSGDPVKHIHEPKRLLLIDPDKTLTGVVKSIKNSIDGDIHIRLLIDDTSLLTKNNLKKENGCLILEIVCGCKTIFRICKDYHNYLIVPNIGDKIIVNGLFVYDKRHKINEIHPVLKIKTIN